MNIKEIMDARAKKQVAVVFAGAHLLCFSLAIVLLGFLGYQDYATKHSALTAVQFKELTTPTLGTSADLTAIEHVNAIDPTTGVPLDVTISGELWQIILVDSYPDAEGKVGMFGGIQAMTNCGSRVITYIRVDNPALLRSNIMHEIMHAGDCRHGGDTYWNSIHPTRFKHIGIVHLSEFLAPFIHDNPIFMLWMASY